MKIVILRLISMTEHLEFGANVPTDLFPLSG